MTSTRNKDVRLSEVSNSIEISIERGDIQVTQSGLPLPKIDVRTRSGEIELGLPAGAKFDLIASSNRGEIENEYGSPLTYESNKRGGTLRGSTGGPSIVVHTDRGKVTVRKSAAGIPGKQLHPLDQ